MVLAYMGRERYFLWLAIAALLSDVLDGALARRLGASSETGRLLDSWADLLIALVSFAGATLLWPDTMRQEARSEERRVGKECRSGWGGLHLQITTCEAPHGLLGGS